MKNTEDKIRIKAINIQLGRKEVSLTIEEAKKLYAGLGELFQEKPSELHAHHHHRHYPWMWPLGGVSTFDTNTIIGTTAGSTTTVTASNTPSTLTMAVDTNEVFLNAS